MGKKGFLIGGAIIIVVAAGLYGGLVVYPASEFRAALRQSQQFLPAGTSLTYKSADYSLFADRGILTSVTFSTVTPPGLAITADKVEIRRPSFTFGSDWQKAAANPKMLKPEAAIPLAAAVSFTKIGFRTGKMTENIASAHIEGLRFYPWALLHPGVPSWTDALATLHFQHPPKSLAAILPLLRLESAVVLGVGYTHAEANDIITTSEVPATARMPAHRVTYRFATSISEGNNRGKFGPGTALHGEIVLGPPVGTLSIKQVAVSGVNAREPFTHLLTASTVTASTFNGLSIGRFEMWGMTLKPPSRPPVMLGNLILSRIAISAGLPVSASLAWNNLHLTRAEMPSLKARLAFDQLGVRTMTVDFGAAYDWELQADRIALQTLRFKIAELGSLDMSASLVGVKPDRSAFEQASLARAVVHYKDASLVRRVFAAAARTMHADPKAFRQQIIAMMQSRAAEFNESPAITEAAKEIGAFLQDPHSLTVELAPAKPLPLAALRNASSMAPPDLVALLGVNVTANQ